MMLFDILKRNDSLRSIVKKGKIYREYLHDARQMSRYYLGASESRGKKEYRIMLLVHSLEKGMCMPNPRPFGYKKVVHLVHILSDYNESNKKDFEYKLGIAILKAWCSFCETHGWTEQKEYRIASEYAQKNGIDDIAAGSRIMSAPHITELSSFDDVVFSRHSVRDFADIPLKEDDIQYALKCFLEAPTACNRQMCKVYYITNPNMKNTLDNTIMGVAGFNKKTVNYFVITYDTASLDYYGERNQGHLNTGLVAMNFVNGLHARGIGSCFMQWSNKYSEDLQIRKLLKLPESERIGIVIGAGYYLNESTIPCSFRKSIEDIYRVI